MLSFPIAERELRIAARSPRTFRSRSLSAGLVFGIFLLLYWCVGSRGSLASGKIFAVLSLLSFIYALFAGIVLTSDCVSSEKREGTLGLLFLTALKPWDIVAGNILGTGLKAFYGLLAVLPVLGISMTVGGVSYAEFGRVCLALITTIAFSLSFSFFVSCLSRKHLVATSRAAFGLFFFAVVVPAFCAGMRRLSAIYATGWVRIADLFSPSTLFDLSRPSFVVFNDFWWSCLAVNVTSALLLFFSCLLLPRTWKDRTGAGHLGKSPGLFFWRGFSLARLGRIQALNRNPFFWLASRKSHESVSFLLLAVGAGLLASFASEKFLARFLGGRFQELIGLTAAWTWAAVALHAVLLFKFAALSSCRLAEDRKLGSFELFLVTPLSVPQIIRGQWLALSRQLGGPVLAVTFLNALILWSFLIMAGMQEGIPGGAWVVFQTVVVKFQNDGVGLWPVLCMVTIIIGSALVIALDWMALAWVGMWIGLRTRRPAMAPWITLAIVILPPLPIYAFILILADWMGFSQVDFIWAWFCILAGFLLEVANAFLLIVFFWRKVAREFRSVAADQFGKKEIRPFDVAIRWTRRAALTGSVAAALILLFYGEEKWRGLRAWRQVEKAYALLGEKVLTRPIPPALVPDRENFGAGAIFKPLFDYRRDAFGNVIWGDPKAWRSLVSITVTGDRWSASTNQPRATWALQQSTDLTAWQKFYQTNANFTSVSLTGAPPVAVLSALTLFDPELPEIEKLAPRPYSHFPIHYEEGWGAIGWHQRVLENIAEILQLRASAELQIGDQRAALADVHLILRLAAALMSQTGYYPARARFEIIRDALQPVWEGLARHQWDASQLIDLQTCLEIDLLSEYPRIVRDEVVSAADFWNGYTELRKGFFPGWASRGALFAAKIYPDGWKWLNQAGLLMLSENDLLPIVDSAAHRVFPAKASRLSQATRNCGVTMDPIFHMVLPRVVQCFTDLPPDLAHAQVSLDQAVIACAVEQWWQKHGAFPAQLSLLIPDCIKTIPQDCITGELFKYSLQPSGQFLLYSVGWNQRDDGGNPVLTQQPFPQQDIRSGDWLWRYPPEQ
ncbi:MAG TPA: ABC transporter permease subunit [Verrucomicrobiae bacterium]|nr:ABC transporter permease subunit [Verrucomicrobiae bacterium]